LVPGPTGTQAVECVELRGVPVVAFNRECAVSVPVPSGRVELVVQRSRRSMPPVRLAVVLP
jgi:hypothetical protein